MNTQVTMSNTAEGGALAGGGWRPLRDKRTKQFAVNSQGYAIGNHRGIQVNSNLRAKEWTLVDGAIMQMPSQVFVAIDDLRSTGNVDSVGSLGIMRVEWGVSSEKPLADQTMDGRTRVDRARADRKYASVALPITHQDYEIGWRELESSRVAGHPLDLDEARESAKSVAETLERMVMLGATVGGETIYGYTNHPNRLTDTATNYGGGDWGTLGNAYKSINGALAALATDRYRGEVVVYAAPAQYAELMAINTDGSGDMEIDRVLRHPKVTAVKEHDLLSAGNILVVGLGTGAFRYQEAMGITNREWTSSDGMSFFAKVMAAATFKIRPDFESNLPLVHITGA